MRKRSLKRAKEERQYSSDRKKYIESHEYCEAEVKCFVGQATDVHHKKGRVGSLLLDQRFWLAVCRACHEWIEAHPLEAKERGFSLSRLETNTEVKRLME